MHLFIACLVIYANDLHWSLYVAALAIFGAPYGYRKWKAAPQPLSVVAESEQERSDRYMATHFRIYRGEHYSPPIGSVKP